MNDQPGLFDMAPVPQRGRNQRSGPAEPGRKQAPTARSSLNERPSWSTYAGKHQPCSEGVRLTHLAQSDPQYQPYAHMRPALYRRKFKGEESLMCAPCARHWREADGLGALPSRPVK